MSCSTVCALTYVVRVDPAFTESEVQTIWRGLRSWTEASQGAVCYQPQDVNGGFSLVIIRGSTQEALRPYIDDWAHRAAIYKDGNIVVAMDVSQAILNAVVAHEAGHALGLEHVPNERSIMYYRTSSRHTGSLVAASDLASFESLRCR